MLTCHHGAAILAHLPAVLAAVAGLVAALRAGHAEQEARATHELLNGAGEHGT